MMMLVITSGRDSRGQIAELFDNRIWTIVAIFIVVFVEARAVAAVVAGA